MSTAVRATKSPRELYSIAKHLGTWDPEEIPVAEDRAHWDKLTADQREQLIKVCALFYEGEVSVADTLAWFLLAVPDADRRMFLSTQVYEEVKHAEFFELYFRNVLGNVDTSAYLVPEYKGVLIDELKRRGESMGKALISGDAAQLGLELAMFAAHYMGIIEGVMAVTGYDFFDDLLATTQMFPRLHEGIRLIRADEGRHIVHGLDYLREMLVAHPEDAPPVRELFLQQAMTIPARTEFIFTPNAFGLDKEKMLQIGYAHIEQRMREAGLG
jgi:ribonucleoside-diphosphate reductase beta chain